jgi:predicted site-specific integrase-resolvase
MAEKPKPTPLFRPRAEAAQVLGISLPILQEFVDAGKLTPVRLTGREQGRVFFDNRELEALRDSLVAKAKEQAAAARKKPKVKRRLFKPAA